MDATPQRGNWPKEIYIAAFATGGILAWLLARFAFHAPSGFASAPLIAVLVVGGFPLLYDLARSAMRGEFGADLLAGLSISASAALGEYLAGSVIVLMLSGGTALELYATRRATAFLSALAKRTPSHARKVTESGSCELPLDQVRIGDRLLLYPHEICPADGTVVEGLSTMNEAWLTGEPFLTAKLPGSNVLSGAINGDSALTISVNRLPVDSRYARIMRVMQDAEANRPRMRRIADRLGAWYTPAGVIIAIIAAVLAHDPSRFLAVLVIATPCPLLLAVPVAILGAVSTAAGRGIIVKNPAMLERIATCRTVIFDKTGTLTYGKPALTEVLCAPHVTREQALGMAASLEKYSRHPLSGTILAAARDEGIALATPLSISEKPGHGLNGWLAGTLVQVTGRRALATRNGFDLSQLPPLSAGMECILLFDGQYAAAFHFRDTPRRESRTFVDHLAPHHQVNKVILLSGDREEEVRCLASEVGIQEVFFGKSPEEKVAIVREESGKGPTLFLGDGINDAPAMQAATVGVAFGKDNEITAEAADAVVLETSLAKVDELIHIGRRMRAIGLQSAVGGMALSLVGLGFAAAGYLSPVVGAVAQEVIDIVAILNALRVALPTERMHDEGL